MAFDGKVLADGQVASSKGTLYTVPASTVAYVSFFNIYNTNSSTQTVLVYINSSGTSRLWRRFELAENESADLLDQGQRLVLEAADLIEATTTNATSVDYVIAGVEES